VADNQAKQVFLGGACGLTTWRKDIAIPLFEAAGVSYHNPQMPLGAWKEDDQYDEMRRKDECLVQLFVINASTRGVASVAEVAYLIGARKPVAIVMEDIPAGTDVYGHKLDSVEADDLNRGRIFVRAMAERHNVPIFSDIAEGTRHCIELVKSAVSRLTIRQVASAINDIQFASGAFEIEEVPGGFHLWLRGIHEDAYTGEPALQEGRKWFVSQDCTADDVVRTAFKAVVTWAEHEARETFTYKNVRVFSPHVDLDALIAGKVKGKGKTAEGNQQQKTVAAAADPAARAQETEKESPSQSQSCSV
jgi:hypothetical protein